MSQMEPAPDLPGPDHRADDGRPAWLGFMTAARRKWAYGLLLALAPALVLYGLMTPEEVQVWLNVAASALTVGGFGMAAANTGK